ncbi:MAG: hypothetical protein IJW82_03710 [Clostridia bacterium]|nr:hypothetical protein [Clostridia bacterium]
MWLVVPIYIAGIIGVFGIGMIFDYKTFKSDIKNIKQFVIKTKDKFFTKNIEKNSNQKE